MSLTNEYAEYESGSWASVNPTRCPCHGRGWLFSDLDTTHRCPIHGRGVPHPEAEDNFDWDAHLLTVHRAAYATFRVRSGRRAADFAALCREAMGAAKPTPAAWVNAAEAVAATALEARAHARGFSCRLEAALTTGDNEWYLP